MKKLRQRLPVLFAVMMLPVLAFTILSLWITVRDMRQGVIEANRSALSYYTRELDADLTSLESYLLTFAVYGDGVSDLRSPDANVRMLAQAEAFERLRQDFDIYGADLIFYYAPSSGAYTTVYSQEIDYRGAVGLRETFTGRYEELLTGHRWRVGRLNGRACLYYIALTQVNGPLVYGAVMDIAALQRRLTASPETAVYLTGPDGTVLNGAGTLRQEGIVLEPGKGRTYADGGWMVIREEGEKGFTLWETFPSAPFLGSGSFPLFAGLAALMLLVLAGAMYLIRRWVLRPLWAIEKGLKRFSAGELDYKLDPAGVPEEYARVNAAFNRMTGQIKELKIQVYEEKLRQQQAELNFLYMQMRPHFFLNALTTVGNFARLGQQENLYRFIGFLARYIRYSLRRHNSPVPLREEVGHIENYMDMVGLQSPGSVMLMTDIQDEAADCRILPFSVYTFVENSVKHALSPKKMVSVFLSARVEGDTLLVTVEDDGPGFPPEAIRRFSDPAWLDSPGGDHIGARNVKKSFRLLYGDKASVTLSNAFPSGARVELRLPADRLPEEGQKEELP